MKTLKTIFIALLVTLTFTAAKANTPNLKERLTMRYAINTYVDAFTHGKTAGLAEIIDDNAKFSHNRGQQVISFSKNQILQSLESEQYVEQNCTTTTKIIESATNLVVYKVQMKYQNFSRTNYVTMTDTGNGWKITNVASVFS
ncbi:nuclear transport factor 2 family protein [Mucilaginibacter sp.]|uniref:nuclear transport factor 2 family protein n=1 Tax=Mucilaginibacter sp. TaxID=1882438 RepID=UPI003AFFE5F7